MLFPPTINQFLRQEAPGLRVLLEDIARAAKLIAREVCRQGFAPEKNAERSSNIHGELQQYLDLYAHQQFTDILRGGGQCASMISEENETIDQLSETGNFVVAIDPLDGSGNIGSNIPVGSIFSVYPKIPPGKLSSGNYQSAAGYVLYGALTMLILTVGKGTHGFTLDTSVGEFYLSHPDITIPLQGQIYSINEANRKQFAVNIDALLQEWQQGSISGTYTARYTGSMVADIHRILLCGGIFLYPATLSHPRGKLRLVYECNPMSFLVEQAGGTATNGNSRILDLTVTSPHQRSPLFIGSRKMVSSVREKIYNTQSLSQS